MRRVRTLALAAAALSLVACQSGKPLGLPDGCQPLLGGADCFLPYPSDFFRTDDPKMPSGARVAPTGAARLTTSSGAVFDTSLVHPTDGFSTVPSIVVLLGEVKEDGFVRLEQGGDPSLSPASNTLLLEADGHAAVPHFVDVDARATDPARRALTLHPFVALKPRTRYVVVFHGVTAADGAPLAAPEGFRRLRDRQAAGDPALERLAPDFEAHVFPAAVAAGVPRASLQLAWAFTTGSEEWATADLLRVRELTIAWLAANPAAVTVTRVTEDPTPWVAREVRGTVRGPLFLTSADPGAKLFRDGSGAVAQNGTVEFPFRAVIPPAVKAAAGPSPVLQYGHGFFGSLDELDEDDAAPGLAQAATRTLIGTEWWGMCLSDMSVVLSNLTTNPGHVADLTERVHQAMANWLVLSAAVQGLGALPAFQRPGGEPLVVGPGDAFIGISQGHILGGTMTALNPLTSRVVLQVGGAGLTGLMLRARPFAPLLDFLASSVPDALEQQKAIAAMQRQLDRIDPATWAKYSLREPLVGNAPKQVLMQVGLDDSSVPNLGTFLHARLLGLPVLQPTDFSPWGLEAAGPSPTSALSITDFRLGDPGAFYRVATFAPAETPVHDQVRRLGAVKRQLDAFLRTGVVVQTCQGPCDPE